MDEKMVILGLVLVLLGLIGGGLCCFPIVLVIPGIALMILGVVKENDEQVMHVSQYQYGYMSPQLPPYHYQQPLYLQQQQYQPYHHQQMNGTQYPPQRVIVQEPEEEKVHNE